MPFGNTSDRTKLSPIYSKIEKSLTSGGFRGERLPSGAPYTVLSLAEKQFIDRDLVFSEGARIVYFNEPCNLTVSLGGRDLISIQAVMPGRAILEAGKSASAPEEMLDSDLSFAYVESIGYLCERPELCGSALELSAGLYLPSLRLLGSLEGVRKNLASRGVLLSPMNSLSGNPGDLYTLRYVPPHLADEESAVSFFDALLSELDAYEMSRQRMIFPDASAALEDAAYRALGILSYSRKIGEGEMLCLLSDIRLAISARTDVSDSLPRIEDLNFLSIEGLNCCLLASSDQKCSSEEELDVLRASFLRKYISAKVMAQKAI